MFYNRSFCRFSFLSGNLQFVTDLWVLLSVWYFLCKTTYIFQRWKEYSYIFFTIVDLYIIKGLDACEPHHISRYLYYDEHKVILLAFGILYTVLNQIQIYFFKERILLDILAFVLLYHELQMVILWCLYTQF